MGCPSRMTSPTYPHATGCTGLHVTSSKNDPDLTTNIHCIMDSTETIETIKLATLLSTTIEQEMIVFKIKDLYNSVISQNQSVG